MSGSAGHDRVSEHEIAAVVRGGALVPSNPASFVAMALRHRMAPLLVHAGVASRLPRDEGARLVEHARHELVVAELRDRELARVLALLDAAGLRPLVVKGAHLAHTCYPESYLRPRDDTDLLLPRADAARLTAVLARAGYRRLPDITADVVHGQVLFERAENVSVVLDVHWQIASPRIAAGLLSYDELMIHAVDLPRLGEGARAPAPVHALALACIHQAAHHSGHELLLWMYDIHLIGSRFTPADSGEFCSLAFDRKMARLCAHAIAAAAEFFPFDCCAALLERLAAAGSHEPTAFLVEPRTPLAQLASDLSVTRTPAARFRLLLAHLFPPPAYMRHAYGVSTTALLPLFYGHRIARGAGRWLRGGLRHTNRTDQEVVPSTPDRQRPTPKGPSG